MSLELLGAAPQVIILRDPPEESRWNLLAGAAGGFVGMVVSPKHWVLGLLGGWAVGSNAQAIASNGRTWGDALRRVGCHGIAAATSLAVPSHPAAAWVVGRLAAQAVLGDGDDARAFLDRARRAALEKHDDPLIIDAEIISEPRTSMVKR